MKGTTVKNSLPSLGQSTTADKLYIAIGATIGYAIGRVIEVKIRKKMFDVRFKKKYGHKSPIQPKM